MKILIEKNIMVPMRDGVLLATDLYRNADGGAVPVLVMRLPYDKERSVAPDLMTLVQAGYQVVIQDTRGRFASQGNFQATVQEHNDGVDCYTWVAQQPWCNGQIGTLGQSYLGQVQWLAASAMPAAIKAMAVLIAPVDHYADIAYRGGVLNLGSMLFWCTMMAIGERGRRLTTGQATPQEFQGQAAVLGQLAQLYETLPLAAMPHLQDVFPPFFQWLAHPAYDDFWRSIDARRFEQIDKPVLHIGGWYDIFLNGTLQGFMGMRQHAPNAEVRNQQKLIIGPWSHGTNWTASYHEQEYGLHASGEAAGISRMQQRWFDRWLKGIENGIEQEPPVRIFVMGINQWRDEADWPLPDTRYTPYYLHSAGHANTVHGDGTLSTEPPVHEPADAFVYNPHDPVPSIGGANLTPFASSIGPRDQRSVEVREDVLVFSTPVLTRNLEITGPITAHLHVSSSAPDTDITCKLVDVHPDGRAMLLTDGILRLRYRHSFTDPILLAADEIVPITIDLWSTANVFLAGHQLRIEVSSSCFPKFARNSNTGGDVATETREQYQRAVNRLYHDAAHPSYLLLPIIERE